MKWEKEYDILVVGSGATGFAGGLTGQLKGLSTLIIEKEDRFGGASALSGGGVWIPNNLYLEEAGVQDSYEQAKMYMDATIGDRVPDQLKVSYLKKGPEMLRYFHEQTHYMRFKYAKGYSDYYAHFPGGAPNGRSIEPEIVDLNLLKELQPLLKEPTLSTKGFTMTGQEFHKVNMIMRTTVGKMTSLKLGMRLIKSKLTGAQYASLGLALIARLALAYRDAGGEIWLNAAFKDYIVEDNRVVGLLIEKDGQEMQLKAKHGVILASGGFSQNQGKREQYLPKPTNAAWSSSPPGQTGDIIEPSKKLGAKLDLMERVWGAPSVLDHNGKPYFLVADRAIPSMIIVDQNGNRYLNEAIPYHEFIDKMHVHNEKTNNKAIHSWLIVDKQTKNRYLFMGLFPKQDFPKAWYSEGIVKVGQSIDQLASETGIPEENLKATLNLFNTFAENGKDEDFGRGDHPYDRYYGDPTLKNPNLDKIENPPYYALKVFPGDIGTKGGVIIDEHARVLKEDGSPIEGLYAAGNCSASIMGESYPGPGATLGPGMTFAYLAALHCLKHRDETTESYLL
ncbi:FAD-binding protein [Solibacillus sp. CAU 1738]|uniref:FAD-binding protein n=1 Tax=Solibacillus sp. CAU 1738 TaxID=3140363 RepID=UPI003260DF89